MLKLTVSVTKFGDFLDFGQLFKAFGNNYFAQISHIHKQFLERCQNISFFYWNHFWATFIDIWRFFTGHTAASWIQSWKENIQDRLKILEKYFCMKAIYPFCCPSFSRILNFINSCVNLFHDICNLYHMVSYNFSFEPK